MAAIKTVISIRRKSQRPPDCEKALALMEQAHELLVSLADRGAIDDGSPEAETISYLENAIGMLSPDDEVSNV